MTGPVLAPLRSLRDTVDYGIITIREDEFDAVLRRFPPTRRCVGEQHYNIADLATNSGDLLRVAIVRTVEQGHIDAQSAAMHLLKELRPTCLVLVGIAGAKPEAEFTLGDVIVATRLEDFSVTAQLAGGTVETASRGAPSHRRVQTALANLPAVKSLLGDWNSESALGVATPRVSLSAERFLGDDNWKRKVKDSLSRRFDSTQSARRPLVTAATVASGNTLLKDPSIMERWLEHARELKAVEMELPGVFSAARSVKGDTPVLAIRGISDIVGYVRDPDWTHYACQSAASFAHAFIQADVLNIAPRSKRARPSAGGRTRSARNRGEVEALVDSTNDPVPVVRESAIQALGSFIDAPDSERSAIAEAALLQIAEDRTRPGSNAAATLIADLEEKRRQRQLRDLSEHARQAADAANWSQVFELFNKIHRLDPGYPDTEKLEYRAHEQRRILRLGPPPSYALTDLSPMIDGVALNDHGQALGRTGNMARSSGTWQSLIWEDGTFRPVPGLPGRWPTTARAINNHGHVVGEAGLVGRSGPPRPLLFRNGSTSELDTQGFDMCSALAIDDSDRIIGTLGWANPMWPPELRHEACAVLWRGAEVINLGNFRPIDMNHKGNVLGNDGTVHSVLLTAASPTQLLLPEGAHGLEATGINDGGEVVGHVVIATGAIHASLWTGQDVKDLWTLGGSASRAMAINNRGQVVGQAETPTGETHAFLWEDSVMIDLNTVVSEEGWVLESASDINIYGDIVGTGTHDGTRAAYLLTRERANAGG